MEATPAPSSQQLSQRLLGSASHRLMLFIGASNVLLTIG